MLECKNGIYLPSFDTVMSRPNTTLFGSRPSDHYFRSVCWFVCLFVCAEFFSAVSDPISIKLGHMLYRWVKLCPLEYRGCATPGGLATPKNLYFYGFFWLKKLSRPTVLIGLS